jgi:hypothetical protein
MSILITQVKATATMVSTWMGACHTLPWSAHGWVLVIRYNSASKKSHLHLEVFLKTVQSVDKASKEV